MPSPWWLSSKKRSSRTSKTQSPSYLRAPLLGQRLQQRLVVDPLGDALDRDVLAAAPAVGAERAGGDDHVRVVLEVAHLLLGVAGAEVEGAVAPHAAQRYGVRPAVAAHRDDPVELGVGEPPVDVSSTSGAVAEASPYSGEIGAGGHAEYRPGRCRALIGQCGRLDPCGSPSGS